VGVCFLRGRGKNRGSENNRESEKTGQGLAGFGSRFRGKCFQGTKTAVTARCSYAAVSSHVAATAT